LSFTLQQFLCFYHLVKMSNQVPSRRDFLKLTGTAAFAVALPSERTLGPGTPRSVEGSSDNVLHIAASPVEIAPKQIVSTITYNGKFPGPLLRFREGQQAVVEVHNDTDTPEQLHWHGQAVPPDVDGSTEEGTPFIPAASLWVLSTLPST
jgi:FtsP/CotA-like multicopper oxidase with cupredoxin domain